MITPLGNGKWTERFQSMTHLWIRLAMSGYCQLSTRSDKLWFMVLQRSTHSLSMAHLRRLSKNLVTPPWWKWRIGRETEASFSLKKREDQLSTLTVMVRRSLMLKVKAQRFLSWLWFRAPEGDVGQRRIGLMTFSEHSRRLLEHLWWWKKLYAQWILYYMSYFNAMNRLSIQFANLATARCFVSYIKW